MINADNCGLRFNSVATLACQKGSLVEFAIMEVPQSLAMDTFSPLVSVRPSWQVAQLPEPEKCDVVKLAFSVNAVEGITRKSIKLIDTRVKYLIFSDSSSLILYKLP